MFRSKMSFILLLAPFNLAACGPSPLDPATVSDTPHPAFSRLRVVIHDAPSTDVDEVWVVFDQVSVHHEAHGWKTVVSAAQQVELLSLQGGVVEELGLADLEPGSYSQIRLHVADAWVVVDGERKPLDVPSGFESGLKLIHGFEMPECGVVTLSLDWDVGAHLIHNSHGYKLRPTMSVVSTTDESSCRSCGSVMGNLCDSGDIGLDGSMPASGDSLVSTGWEPTVSVTSISNITYSDGLAHDGALSLRTYGHNGAGVEQSLPGVESFATEIWYRTEQTAADGIKVASPQGVVRIGTAGFCGATSPFWYGYAHPIDGAQSRIPIPDAPAYRADHWYRMRIEVTGTKVVFEVDDGLGGIGRAEHVMSTPLAFDVVRFGADCCGGCRRAAYWDDFWIRW